MMKLDVPFYKQTTKLNCGPVALKMVLDYFGEDLGLENLEKEIESREGQGVATIQLATAASKLGFKTEFFSKNLFFDDSNFELDFYKKYADTYRGESEKIVNKAKDAGVELDEKVIELNDLLSKLGENSLIIALIDWSVVINKKDGGYQGHIVPIVGFDDRNVYVHNHGTHDPRPFYEISREVFDEARKAKGTDEDFLVVHRK